MVEGTGEENNAYDRHHRWLSVVTTV